MLPPTRALVTSTRGDTPVTVTDSSSPPTAMARLRVMVVPTCTSRPERSTLRNPASRATTRYVPGTSCEAEYAPSALLVTSRLTPVASLVMESDTPGSMAPCSSVTRPLICAVPCWAWAGAAANEMSRAADNTRNRRMATSCRNRHSTTNFRDECYTRTHLRAAHSFLARQQQVDRRS